MTLRRAALVHEFGTTAVPNSIWDKPGPLTRAEFDRVELHPMLTEQMLRRSAALAALNPVAAAHHEKADGSGSYTGFLPAVSKDALKRMSEDVRSWRIHLHDAKELQDIAAWVNPRVRGWIAYYGRFFRSALESLLRRINSYLVRWARRKYKRLRAFRKLKKWWDGLTARQPRMFAHWRLTTGFQNGL